MCNKEMRTIAVVVREHSDQCSTPYAFSGSGIGSVTYTYPAHSACTKEYRLRGRWFDMHKTPEGTYTANVYETDDDTDLVGTFPRALCAYVADSLAEDS